MATIRFAYPDLTPAEIKIGSHSGINNRAAILPELPSPGRETRAVLSLLDFSEPAVHALSSFLPAFGAAFTQVQHLTKAKAEEYGHLAAGVTGILVDGKVDPQDIDELEQFVYKSAPERVKRTIQILRALFA